MHRDAFKVPMTGLQSCSRPSSNRAANSLGVGPPRNGALVNVLFCLTSHGCMRLIALE